MFRVIHPLDDVVNKSLTRYQELVIAANKHQNLIARGDEARLINNLVAESLALLEWEAVELRGPVLDIGTGAGIPGIPLAIARTDIQFTLLDSVRKKTDFVKRAAAELELKNVEVIWGRAEEHEGRYGTILSRGVAEINRIKRWAGKLLIEGGQIVVWRGSSTVVEDGWEVKELGGGLKIIRIQTSRKDAETAK